MSVSAEAPRRLALAGTVREGRRTVLTTIPVGVVRSHPRQPRKVFDEAALEELADSVRERGLLQPIIVRAEDHGYVLLAGERRLRAARRAGLHAVPALVREDDPLEIALVENLQREDLNPLEESEALASLSSERGYTHAALASLINKSRPYVTNTLAIARLPEDLKEDYRAVPDLSREVLIAVARQPNLGEMRALWQRLRLQQLSVRRLRETIKETDGSRQDSGRSLLVRRTIRLARRLNRHLRQLIESQPTAAERAQVAPTLRRTRRRIAAIVDA